MSVYYMAGLDGSKEVLLPLSASAQNTLLNLARHAGTNSVLKVSPFCHVGENNDVKGWVLDIPADAPASALPLNCTFFDGISVVEMECTEPEALQLLTKPEETRLALGKAIHTLMSQVTEDRRATWRRCRPTENGVPPSLYSAMLGRDHQVTLCTMPDAIPLIDSEAWVPELSPEGFVGLFHHWHPVRKRLCIYLACQSYLPKACLEFADLVRDLGDSCTAWDILHSEEAQWLRHANARNRARILAIISSEIGLKCPCMFDYCNADQKNGCLMAVVTCETLHHDMIMLSPHKTSSMTINRRGSNAAMFLNRYKNKSTGKPFLGFQDDESSSSSISSLISVRILNHCAGGHQAMIVCAMAPWEGLWLFQGEGHAHDTSTRLFMPTCTAQQTIIPMKKGKMDDAKRIMMMSRRGDDDDEEESSMMICNNMAARNSSFVLQHKAVEQNRKMRLRRLKCTFTSPHKVSIDRLEVLHLWEHQKREAEARSLYLLLLCDDQESQESFYCDELVHNSHTYHHQSMSEAVVVEDHDKETSMKLNNGTNKGFHTKTEEDEDAQLLLMMSGGITTATFEEMKRAHTGGSHNDKSTTIVADGGDTTCEDEVMTAYKRSIAKKLNALPKKRGSKRMKEGGTHEEDEESISSFSMMQERKLNSTEYLVFDEHILQNMVDKGWNRTQGYTILMPMAYGMCKEWWKHKLIEGSSSI